MHLTLAKPDDAVNLRKKGRVAARYAETNTVRPSTSHQRDKELNKDSFQTRQRLVDNGITRDSIMALFFLTRNSDLTVTYARIPVTPSTSRLNTNGITSSLTDKILLKTPTYDSASCPRQHYNYAHHESCVTYILKKERRTVADNAVSIVFSSKRSCRLNDRVPVLSFASGATCMQLAIANRPTLELQYLDRHHPSPTETG